MSTPPFESQASQFVLTFQMQIGWIEGWEQTDKEIFLGILFPIIHENISSSCVLIFQPNIVKSYTTKPTAVVKGHPIISANIEVSIQKS